jgi:hypothetical protein
MGTTGEACERKRQLLQDLLSQISKTQGKMTSQSGNKHTELDGMFQRAVDARVEALKALENHQQEHGC